MTSAFVSAFIFLSLGETLECMSLFDHSALSAIDPGRNLEMGTLCIFLGFAAFVKIVIAFFGAAGIAMVLFTLKKDFWKSNKCGQWRS